MADANITISCTIGGKNIYKAFTKSADHPNPYIDIPLPVGKALGTWVKVDADEGSGVLVTGHGWVTGTFDVYWTESGVFKKRYAQPTTIAGDAVTFTAGGAGDDFPANGNTSMVLSARVHIHTQIDGDAAVAICVCCEYAATSETLYSGVNFLATATTVKHMHLPPNEPVIWWTACGYANPLTGTIIDNAEASNGSPTNAATLTILVLEDSTP